MRSNLEFRGAILDDLERMGLRYDCRDDELRLFLPGELLCNASRPQLEDFLAMLRCSLQSGFTTCRPEPDIEESSE